MSVTRLAMRTALRQVYTDSTVITDDQLNQWINEAIGELQAHLPPVTRGSILVTAAGQREYSLSAFTSMIFLHEVEYPSGQTPPRLLALRSRARQDFLGGQYYDLLDLVPYKILILAETPAVGETILLTHTYRYPLPAADADLIIVPEEQHPILHLYVHWKAALHESFAALTAATPSDALGKELRLNAVRAEEMFWRRIADLKAGVARSAVVQWIMEG